MKIFKKRGKTLLALCMALLLCLGATGIAAATDTPPAEKDYMFDNYYSNWDEVYCYAWNGNVSNAQWPGERMTDLEGSALWKATLEEGAYEWVIFNNGQNEQTLDLMLLANYDTFYGNHMSSGKVNGFWRNSSDYARVVLNPYGYWNTEQGCYISYWGDTIAQNWPGVKMQELNGYYFSWVPQEAQSIILNNGGNGKQTATLQRSTFPTSTIGLTGVITGQDIYGNDLYEIKFLPNIG